MQLPSGVPFDRIPGLLRPWSPVAPSSYQWTITGTVYDGSAAPLAGYVCHLFDAATDAELAITTTNASGVYTFHPPTNTGFYYVTAFSPNGTLAGTTPNNLVAT